MSGDKLSLITLLILTGVFAIQPQLRPMEEFNFSQPIEETLSEHSRINKNLRKEASFYQFIYVSL